jgi:hypothetical protein
VLERNGINPRLVYLCLDRHTARDACKIVASQLQGNFYKDFV